MTKIKDEVRLASLFTMQGLYDPRFTVSESESRMTTEKANRGTVFSRMSLSRLADKLTMSFR